MEVVPLGDGHFAFRSDFLAVELSGDTATEFAEKVLSQLQEPRTFEEIARMLPGYRAESIRGNLDALVHQGILACSSETGDEGDSGFATLLLQLGLDAGSITGRLAGSKVAIFGLEAHGAHLARMLADAGVGTILLVDPFPFRPAHFLLTPVQDPSSVGKSREAAVSAMLSRPELRIETGGDVPLTEARVRKLADGCHLLISCWDRGSAVHHWINNAARAGNIPALFSELRGTFCFSGPFYFPDRSACWMCYRMRSIGCEPDFGHAMAYEEHLDRKKEPCLARRPVLPILPIQLASQLGIEALKYLSRLNQPALVDKVLEYDALTSASCLHPVLVKPDCPSCSKKKIRSNPSRSEICSAPQGITDLPGLAGFLVSPRTGIVTDIPAAPRDPSESPRPLVRRARLANHRFVPDDHEIHTSCSGKGMTPREALQSSLGEAVERYSGGVWSPDELVIACRKDLDGPSLDPADLVLFRPEQYPQLKYSPYTEESRLAWVQARSLISDESVWVPAIAVFMEYHVHGPEDFLFPVTSNGLAAGSSLCDAVLGGIYEVLERDALMIAWLNRMPGKVHEADNHPDRDVRWMARSYRRRNVRLALVKLPTDHPVSVFMGIAFREGGREGPYATVGLGASLDPLKAARQAALEVGQVRPTIRRRIRSIDARRMAELGANPADVKSLEDHALLYANPSTAGSFDFLFGERARWEKSRTWASPDALRHLLDHFGSKGQEVLYVNLTPPDLEPFGLYAARAILPGFQPVWFGRQERRLGGRRLYQLPRVLGFRQEDTNPSMLNPMPHPLA